MTTSPLSSLATELVEIIVSLLDAGDILSLRLTCRNIQEKSFHFFCCRFFKYLETDLSHSSLVRINALSKHRQFRAYVRGLVFVLGKGIGRDIIWDRHPWGLLSSPLKVKHIQVLRDNLIHNFIYCRSFFVACRYPEGRPDLDRMTVSDAVAVFFAMMADSHFPIKSFHLIYASQQPRPLPLDMRRIPPLLHRKLGFSDAWSHLQELVLQQYLTLESFPFLLDLILSAANLRILRLTMSSNDVSAGFIHELASSDSLPRLQELGLSRTSVEAGDLRTLLRRLSGNLRILCFHDILMLSDDWLSILEELKLDFPVLKCLDFNRLRVSSPSCGLLTFPALQKMAAAGALFGQADLLYFDGLSAPTGIGYVGPAASEVPGMLQTTASLYHG